MKSKNTVPECPYAAAEKFDKAKWELLCRAYGISKVYGKWHEKAIELFKSDEARKRFVTKHEHLLIVETADGDVLGLLSAREEEANEFLSTEWKRRTVVSNGPSDGFAYEPQCEMLAGDYSFFGEGYRTLAFKNKIFSATENLACPLWLSTRYDYFNDKSRKNWERFYAMNKINGIVYWREGRQDEYERCLKMFQSETCDLSPSLGIMFCKTSTSIIMVKAMRPNEFETYKNKVIGFDTEKQKVMVASRELIQIPDSFLEGKILSVEAIRHVGIGDEIK